MAMREMPAGWSVQASALGQRLSSGWRTLTAPWRRERRDAPAAPEPAAGPGDLLPDIAPDDPLLALFQGSAGAVDLDTLTLRSRAVDALRAAGVRLVVPLISQGELIGLLNLGPRLSEQDYSAEDRTLLERLAAQAAPAVRVAQLIRQQEEEARQRERIEQELRVARVIQQNFLPRRLPDVPGWGLAARYRPAREVSGDFYDFIELPHGLLGIVVGDVTDKGVPAALVMTATRSVLRACALRLISPGAVLEQVNDLVCPDTPANMFITCFYAVLDPASGRLRYANAGHNVPYVRSAAGVQELRATGMPLGLMPGMAYEEKESTLAPDSVALLYSDGLIEAHNPARKMFGFPRLAERVAHHPADERMVDGLLDDLDAFVGPEWEREDDVTLVTLRRVSASPENEPPPDLPDPPDSTGPETVLAEFTLPSEDGNDAVAADRVADAVRDVGLEERRLARLKTAVGEAALNAIEHGNQRRPDLPVAVRVSRSDSSLWVDVSDQGGALPFPEAVTPDIEAKLAGRDRARGWGLFLMQRLADGVRVTSDGERRTVRLTFRLHDAPNPSNPSHTRTHTTDKENVHGSAV